MRNSHSGPCPHSRVPFSGFFRQTGHLVPGKINLEVDFAILSHLIGWIFDDLEPIIVRSPLSFSSRTAAANASGRFLLPA